MGCKKLNKQYLKKKRKKILWNMLYKSGSKWDFKQFFHSNLLYKY